MTTQHDKEYLILNQIDAMVEKPTKPSTTSNATNQEEKTKHIDHYIQVKATIKSFLIVQTKKQVK